MKDSDLKNRISPRSTKCPHCKSKAVYSKSTELTPCYRRITFRCSNDDCGHIFVCGLNVEYTNTLSSIPDPTIRIPLSKHIKKYALAAQLKANGMIATEQGELDV